MEINKKQCRYCHYLLPLDCFRKDKRNPDGHQNRCKECHFDLSLSNRNSKKEMPRSWYYIPDIYLVGYGRTQMIQHCCLICEKPFFCQKKIKDRTDLICDRCFKKDFEVAERNISKINFIGNVVGWIVKTESPSIKRSFRNYKKVYKRDNYTCQYCGYNLLSCTEFLELNIDHIKPWVAMGGNSMDNLVVSCKECNLIASDKWFEDFEGKKEFILTEKRKRGTYV